MSYVRFGEDGSDVYVYCSVLGSFVCDYCLLENRRGFSSFTRSGMIAHLQKHIEAGHVVPSEAIERLQEEIETEGDEYKQEEANGESDN